MWDLSFELFNNWARLLTREFLLQTNCSQSLWSGWMFSYKMSIHLSRSGRSCSWLKLSACSISCCIVFLLTQPRPRLIDWCVGSVRRDTIFYIISGQIQLGKFGCFLRRTFVTFFLKIYSLEAISWWRAKKDISSNRMAIFFIWLVE